MPTFNYRAVGDRGRYENGRITAANPAEARRRLREQGLNPIQVTNDAGAGTANAGEAPGKREIKQVDLDQLRLSRAKADKLTLAFLEKLHQLVENGLPLGDAVKSLNQRLSDPVLHAISEQLWRDLSEGLPLAVAMRRRPKFFEPTLASMVEAGEATGNLEPILRNIVELLESRIALRKQILAGLSYPAFILIIAFLVMLIVLFYLMPKVEQMLDSMGGELSLPAKLVLGFANFSVTGGPFLLVFGVAFGAALFQWRKTEEGRLATDRFMLRAPILKEVILNAELSRLANLAAILLSSGVDTTDALKLLEKGFRNEDIRRRFRAARSQIADGASFSNALQNQNIVTDMDADVLSISENTGSLVKGFSNIHRVRRAALEDQMKRLTTVIATGALLAVFVFVFLLVFGIVSSIMELSSSIVG